MGRKPKYDKPMTATERSRAYRLRKLQEGATEIHFSISGETAKQIDDLIEFYELSGRAQVVEDLLRFPLSHALESMNKWKNNPDIPKQSNILHQDDKAAFREMKHMLWNSLAASLEDSKQLWAALKEDNK